MRLTDFGVFIRKFRLDHSVTLRDMAKAVGISSPYLSGIECGTRSIPEGLEEKLIKIFNISGQQAEDMKLAIDRSKSQFTLKTEDCLDRDLVGALNRKLSTLDDDQKKQIIQILNGGRIE